MLHKDARLFDESSRRRARGTPSVTRVHHEGSLYLQPYPLRSSIYSLRVLILFCRYPMFVLLLFVCPSRFYELPSAGTTTSLPVRAWEEMPIGSVSEGVIRAVFPCGHLRWDQDVHFGARHKTNSLDSFTQHINKYVPDPRAGYLLERTLRLYSDIVILILFLGATEGRRMVIFQTTIRPLGSCCRSVLLWWFPVGRPNLWLGLIPTFRLLNRGNDPRGHQI